MTAIQLLRDSTRLPIYLGSPEFDRVENLIRLTNFSLSVNLKRIAFPSFPSHYLDK